MDVLAERGQLRVSANDILAHVLGMRAGVADPLYAVHSIDAPKQLGERGALLLAEIPAIGVDVLPEQGHFTYAVGCKPANLLDQLSGRSRYLSASSRRHDAVATYAVASDADLHPPLKLALALCRQTTR